MARCYVAPAQRENAVHCSLLPNTVEGQGRVHISFNVDIENEILCHEPGMSAVIFMSSKNFR